MIATAKTTMEFAVSITLTEPEARALEAMLSYDKDAFLKWFYENMGESALKPHHNGAKSLFGARQVLAAQLGKIDRTRQAFNES